MHKEQLPLMKHTIDHPHAVEMELIDKILEKTSTIYELALQDLTQNPPPKRRYGYLAYLKEHFFKNFRKISRYYGNLMESLLIGYF